MGIAARIVRSGLPLALAAAVFVPVTGGAATGVDATAGSEPVNYAFSDSCAVVEGARTEIFVAEADGTGRVAVSEVGDGTDPGQNTGPVWSPDGTRIAWSGTVINQTEIYVADADGENRMVISDVGPGVSPSHNVAPDWSPDGSRIAWTGSDGTFTHTYVADPDGGNRVVFDAESSSAEDGHVEWSPDGTRIVWRNVDPVDSRSELFVADPDGGNAISFAEPAATATQPTWSPDGSLLLWRGGFNQQLYVADADGTDLVEIVDWLWNGRPVWRPDGTKIAWSGQYPPPSAPRGILIADPDGTNVFDISRVGDGPQSFFSTSPDWSPDSGRIAWAGTDDPSYHDGEFRIYVADADGSDRTEISSVGPGLDPIDNDQPRWSPDGTKIAWSGFQPQLCGGSTFPCPTDATPFLDVPASSFAFDDVACIYGLDITTGTGPTTYSPDDFATREQMASFLARLWRAFDIVCPGGPTPFTDVASTSFAFTDVACIYALGITTGTGPTTYSPIDFVTREQMASFLARLWRALDLVCPVGALPFADVSAGSFARDDIVCIHGLGVTTGTSPTTYSPDDFVTREQMASFLARLWRAASV